uniref:Protein kinase domain-containing protein n=1 Tax=Rhabditophanes sp. KR3021 TaxID=114890 RepID=A0AC35TR17_9BILA
MKRPGFAVNFPPNNNNISNYVGIPPEIGAIMNTITYRGVQYFNVTEKDFLHVHDLGSGCFGNVSKVHFTRVKDESIQLAVKLIKLTMNPADRRNAYMDCRVILNTHTHKNIVNCYGIVLDQQSIFICMEVMQTCLDKLIDNYFVGIGIPEQYVRIILVEILCGLKYLKSCKFMHRDVKPSNMLLNWDGMVKICDFGLSGTLLDSQVIGSDGKGDYRYLAPERVSPSTSRRYTARSDVWSLCVSMYQALTSENPFGLKNATPFHTYDLIVNVNVDLTRINGNDDMINFIQSGLQKIPENRPNCDELWEHPLVQKALSAKTSREYQIELSDWIGLFLNPIISIKNNLRCNYV